MPLIQYEGGRMRLTTKGRFAVTAMLDLALRESAGPVPLNSISLRQEISLSYLEQLFGRLRRKGLVDSARGPGGGYALAKPAQNISVADIVLSVDEPLDATQCAGKENCRGGNGEPCMTHQLWTNLSKRMVDYLESVSLQQLMDDQYVKHYVRINQIAPAAPGKDAVSKSSSPEGGKPLRSQKAAPMPAKATAKAAVSTVTNANKPHQP